MVGPQARWEAVRVACEEGKLSERRACGLVGIARGSVRYERRERDDRGLCALMKELAVKRPRFGYRRLHVLLRREKQEDGTMRWQVKGITSGRSASSAYVREALPDHRAQVKEGRRPNLRRT